MKTSSTLRSQFIYLPKHVNLATPSAKLPPLKPPKVTPPPPKHTSSPSPSTLPLRTTIPPREPTWRLPKTNQTRVPLISRPSKDEFSQLLPKGYSRLVICGAVSAGVVLLLMGIDVQKALALGPEGPLMEDFWDNMRRYALYALTVSTGVAYAVFQPILELLKNPISAVLILIIIGGSVYVVSQVLSAMVGVTDFSYQYGY